MNVKTAARTLDLFEAFATSQKPLSLSELAGVLHMPVSSCFALVRTLENRGYVYMLAPRKGIYPTKRLLDIAQNIAVNDLVLERVQPALSALRDATGETIVFSKRQADRVVYLDVYEASSSIRYNTQVGEFRLLHSNSVGKAFLGAMEDDQLKETLATLELPRFTSATLTTQKALRADLALSRERGYYININESVADLMGVAVTVSLAKELYGITVAGPLYRMQPNLNVNVQAIQAARDTIESAEYA
ncbi:IclR family transcriptional regulator [Alcaligenaceae bacterium]|nr:IclR family transcriptional regulator [Alcaligenaceae bacterium]